MSIVLDNLREMIGYFSDVALVDPLSAILLALGTVLTAVALTIFGGLSLGGLLSPFTEGKY